MSTRTVMMLALMLGACGPTENESLKRCADMCAPRAIHSIRYDWSECTCEEKAVDCTATCAPHRVSYSSATSCSCSTELIRPVSP